MRKPLQNLSREDTCHLRSGVCPACNKTLFIIGGLYHHERGSHRRILCIHCLREFGVAPIDGGQAVILHFVMPAHRLASDYNIHSGTLATAVAPQALDCANGKTGSVPLALSPSTL
jgi:hypothetical protein